jgi:hypothetical protein
MPGRACKQYTPVVGEVTDANPADLTSNGDPPLGLTCAHAWTPEPWLLSFVADATPPIASTAAQPPRIRAI